MPISTPSIPRNSRKCDIFASHFRLKSQIFNYMPTTPYFTYDKIEREGVTDWTTPENPSLEDLGVSLTQFDVMARFVLFSFRRNAYYQEKFGEFADPEPPKPAEFYQPKAA